MSIKDTPHFWWRIAVGSHIMAPMCLKEWLYIAPQRIRAGKIALPRIIKWDQVEARNLQRFARALEFRGCVAFVGAAASECLGYPGWKDLLPDLASFPDSDPQDVEERRVEYSELYKALRREREGDAPAVKGDVEVDAPQALQIAEELLGGEHPSKGREKIIKYLSRKFSESRPRSSANIPLKALMKMPLYRFVTTNYDEEIERQLGREFGIGLQGKHQAFSQDEASKLGVFTIALAKGNRRMVFHCHGMLQREVQRLDQAEQGVPCGPSAMVLTEADYNYWYLSRDPGPRTFQMGMQVLLQSNPLFFIGYSLSDSELVRILRYISLRPDSGRTASNVFALIGNKEKWSGSACRAKQIKSGINLFPFKYAVKQSDFKAETLTLHDKLNDLRDKAELARLKWREQPAARRATAGPIGAVLPRSGTDALFDRGNLVKDPCLVETVEALDHGARMVAFVGPVGAGKLTRVSQLVHSNLKTTYTPIVFHPYNNDDIYSYVKRIADAVEETIGVTPYQASGPAKDAIHRLIAALDRETGSPVLLVISNVDLFLDMRAGRPDTGAHREELPVELQKEEHRNPAGLPGETFTFAPSDDASMPPLQSAETGRWMARNKASEDLVAKLLGWAKSTKAKHRVVVTTRELPKQWCEKEGLLPGGQAAPAVKAIVLDRTRAFPQEQLALEYPALQGIEPKEHAQERLAEELAEYKQLTWELQEEQSALLLASAFVADFDPLKDKAPLNAEQFDTYRTARRKRLRRLLQAVRSNSSERGTRVVRQVVRDLDQAEIAAGDWEDSDVASNAERINYRKYEHLLTFLACLNTPFDARVFEQCVRACDLYLKSKATGKGVDLTGPFGIGAEQAYVSKSRKLCQRLHQLRLIEAIGAEPKEGSGVEAANFIVPRSVKTYCRKILERTEQPEMRACGVHGLLSRGPFNSPGASDKPRFLFDHFASSAFDKVQAAMRRTHSTTSKSDTAQESTGRVPIIGESESSLPVMPVRENQVLQNERDATLYIRAALDILRTNFACNSVPQWGRYIDYIEMLSMTIDLIKNLARAQEKLWTPGMLGREGAEWSSNWLSAEGVASAEEMIYLYNELGLAYYQTGSVQDALSVWGLAMDWQKAIATLDESQGTMYSASLNAHLAMGYLQLGRMETARECTIKAHDAAQKSANQDLRVRMEGILGRIEHFQGNIPTAAAYYQRAVLELRKRGNYRAESYFLRHWAALERRFGSLENAERMAKMSMSIGASENARDLVAFSSELLSQIYRARGDTVAAIRESRIALKQAQKLDISRLQADVLLGLASIQLSLGDANAARSRAIEALILANEHLLVLRQIKALVLLGETAAELGQAPLGLSYVEHAISIASDAQFRLAEHDAEEALARLRIHANAGPSQAAPGR